MAIEIIGQKKKITPEEEMIQSYFGMLPVSLYVEPLKGSTDAHKLTLHYQEGETSFAIERIIGGMDIATRDRKETETFLTETFRGLCREMLGEIALSIRERCIRESAPEEEENIH